MVACRDFAAAVFRRELLIYVLLGRAGGGHAVAGGPDEWMGVD